ncbi:MAG: pentapeptide repeat-containing protein [Bacteroidetes bacterium]|nr:pentapeptide repeat-containing protein [Bacteroidota bacterium]
MPEALDVKGKLFEIISDIQKYDSPEKIEDLKRELKFLKENDAESLFVVGDYGENLNDVIDSFSGSDPGYVFCFPGVTVSPSHIVPSRIRLVPVSTAFSGIDFSSWEIYTYGYFAGAYMRYSDFSTARLEGADLTGADVQSVIFSSANLTNAKIHNANFKAANLTNATLPEYAATVAQFKEVVGRDNWDEDITWTDGLLINEIRPLE